MARLIPFGAGRVHDEVGWPVILVELNKETMSNNDDSYICLSAILRAFV